MPGAGPWQDERHRFRRGDKGPTLPPRGYAAPSPSSRGGPGTGSNLRDLTSKDGDVLRARFPAGGSTSNILPKGLPVFRVHQSISFLHVRNGSIEPFARGDHGASEAGRIRPGTVERTTGIGRGS